MNISLFIPLIIVFFMEAGLGSFGEHFDKFGSKYISDECIEFAYHLLLLRIKENLGRKKNFFKCYKFLSGNCFSKTFQIFGFFVWLVCFPSSSVQL